MNSYLTSASLVKHGGVFEQTEQSVERHSTQM